MFTEVRSNQKNFYEVVIFEILAVRLSLTASSSLPQYYSETSDGCAYCQKNGARVDPP